MGEIVAQVKRVTDLIGEITAASLEQSSGVTQVNDAVTQLDQTTQQNAALVQQSAAAAASLREQADRLAEAVAMFRLSRDQTRQLIAKAQAASRAQASKPAPGPAAPRVRPVRKRDSGGSESRRKDDGWDEF
jgi:ABC-type transporter Mla subunit MlaD